MPLPMEEFKRRSIQMSFAKRSPYPIVDERIWAAVHRTVPEHLGSARDSIASLEKDLRWTLQALSDRRAELADMKYLNGDTDTYPEQAAPGDVTAMAEIVRALGDAGPEEVSAALFEAGYGSRHTSGEEGRASVATGVLRPFVGGFRGSTPNPHPKTR